MQNKPVDFALADKTIALMFGDMTPAFFAALRRLGAVPVAFVLEQVGRNWTLSSQELAKLWRAELKRPVDYGVIELVVSMRDRIDANRFLRWRVVQASRKSGLTELARQELSAA